jgi:hypothetical protein
VTGPVGGGLGGDVAVGGVARVDVVEAVVGGAVARTGAAATGVGFVDWAGESTVGTVSVAVRPGGGVGLVGVGVAVVGPTGGVGVVAVLAGVVLLTALPAAATSVAFAGLCGLRCRLVTGIGTYGDVAVAAAPAAAGTVCGR